MGRKIDAVIQDRINRLRRLLYFVATKELTSELEEVINEFLDTTLANVEFILLEAVIEDSTPIELLSTGRLQEIAKALNVPRYRYLSRSELLILIEKNGESYGTTYSHPNAASKNNIRRLLARRIKESKNKDSKEV